MVEPILETDESPATKSLAARQDRGTTTPTPLTNQAKSLMPEALMRTNPPQGTPGGPHVEKTLEVAMQSMYNHLHSLLVMVAFRN